VSTFLSSGWQDLRFALRNLNKDRRFAFLAILALSLGIGSVTVIFSAVYGVLIDTFPYAHFDRMVSFSIDEPGRPFGREMLTIPEFLDFRDQNHVFLDMNAGPGREPILYRHNGQTTEWTTNRGSANTYVFLGVKPLLGRLITPDDTKPDAPPVFMMTYKLWKEQFNKDPKILGKTFDLNGKPWTLVGIMPPRFRAGWSDIFTAFPMDRAAVAQDPTLAHVEVWPLGFLKPGVTIDQAAADLNVVAHNLAKVYPDRYPKEFRVSARSFRTRVIGMFEPIIYPLFGAVGLLLLISCTNVANLLLSRATVRDREIAVRASLGATRWRLIRQLLVESFVLAAAGCLFGCFFAWLGIKELVPLVPYNNFPQESVIELNWIVLLAAMGLAVLSTVLCGLVPAIHAIGGTLLPRLSGAGQTLGGHGRGRLRSVLAVAEMALSIVLLVAASLMMRSFFSMTHRDLGYDPQHILTTGIDLPPGFYEKGPDRQMFFDKLLAKLKRVPGVSAVAEAATPFEGFRTPATVPGSTHPDKADLAVNMVSEDYFQIYASHSLHGRMMSADDAAQHRLIVIVNQTFVRQFFPTADPLGHKIDFEAYDELQAGRAKTAAKPGSTSNPPPSQNFFDIVGVVSDIRATESDTDHSEPVTYVPSTTVSEGLGGILVRTDTKADHMVRDVDQAIWSLEPNARIGTDTGSLQAVLQKYVYAGPEFEFVMLSTFAAVGLTLVVIGVYSVMAYNVSLLTREIGIRMALGAQRDHILRTVLRKGMILILAGLAVGLFASWGATRLIAGYTRGVKPTDPWTFAAVIVVILVIGLLACFFPARRATQVHPLAALRHE
jgi:putative ABC transport system permease protein